MRFHRTCIGQTDRARVRDVFLDLARDDPAWQLVDVTGDRRVRSIDEIAADVLRRVNELVGP